jgi:hypothetical protein
MTTCEHGCPENDGSSNSILSYLNAATVTFSAGEEIDVYTSIFAIHRGVSIDTPFSLWILDSFICSTLVKWQPLCLYSLALSLVQFRS